ncbi:hypothetical protein ATANTOWER_023955 [Ataeniobius toweri]|uniref:Uncharacterized protein n=1 Tax=Ataeniobius toweri TaxID=208326 RepID=A0ABU7ALF9_9TELE|nr:hypothetical protein [Ataeniobius toweri]
MASGGILFNSSHLWCLRTPLNVKLHVDIEGSGWVVHVGASCLEARGWLCRQSTLRHLFKMHCTTTCINTTFDRAEIGLGSFHTPFPLCHLGFEAEQAFW